MGKDPIRRIRNHVFYGRKYKFIYDKPSDVISEEEYTSIKKKYNMEEDDDIVGLTDANRNEKLELIVSDELEEENPKELLRVLLDEAIHALDSTIDNDVVDEYARDLTSFLWRCGYRRITGSEKALLSGEVVQQTLLEQ